jgi:CubicO group peptidase (beta-lactamase class C family)
MTAGTEVGAALGVCVDKEPVIDLWAGHTDAARTRAWARDTIVNLFSVGKAITALCALRLVEAGRLDLDTPVTRYWPEFAQAGKGQLRVRHLLTHQAGLPAIARPLPPEAWSQWDVITGALASQAPWWEPGSSHGYHVNTQGFLIGEVVRRVTGKSLGTYLRESLTAPAGIDFFIGFGPALDGRCADYLPPPPTPERDEFERRLSVDPATLSGLALMRINAYRNPPNFSGMAIVNTRAWRAAEVPSTNGHGNARAVARLYSALAGDGELDGVHMLAPATVARAIEEQVNGSDIVLERPHPLRTRLPTHHARAAPRPQPVRLRAFRRRRLAWLRRSRRAGRHRLRHESGPPSLAAQARAPPDRPGVRRAVVSLSPLPPRVARGVMCWSQAGEPISGRSSRARYLDGGRPSA